MAQNMQLHRKENTMNKKKEKSRKREGIEYSAPPPLSQMEQTLELMKCTSLCNSTAYSGANCILEMCKSSDGSYSYDLAARVLGECREITRVKDKPSKMQFLQNEFIRYCDNMDEVLRSGPPVDHEEEELRAMAEAEAAVEAFCSPCSPSTAPTEAMAAAAAVSAAATAKKGPRFLHKWKISNEATGWKEWAVYRMCWATAFDYSKHHLDKMSIQVRVANDPYCNPNPGRDYNDKTYHGSLSYDTTLKAMMDVGVGQVDAMLMARAGMTRNTEVSQMAVEWFEEYFYDHADPAPNRLEWHLDLCDKKDMWKVYWNEMYALYGCADSASYSDWLDVWNNVFPWVKLRVYKQVSGKCWVCFRINDLRKRHSEKNVLQAAKILHQQHRGGLYMLERKR
jgi:hypothetical protein